MTDYRKGYHHGFADGQKDNELVKRLQAENERLVKGLASIALNSCCEGCQEAKKVAMATLNWHDKSLSGK